MYPWTVRQTQWLDPFNRDQPCGHWLWEEDMLKNSKKVSNFQFLCIVQVTRIYIAVEEKLLGFVLVSKWHKLYGSSSFLKRMDPFCAEFQWIVQLDCLIWTNTLKSIQNNRNKRLSPTPSANNFSLKPCHYLSMVMRSSGRGSVDGFSREGLQRLATFHSLSEQRRLEAR